MISLLRDLHQADLFHLPVMDWAHSQTFVYSYIIVGFNSGTSGEFPWRPASPANLAPSQESRVHGAEWLFLGYF